MLSNDAFSPIFFLQNFLKRIHFGRYLEYLHFLEYVAHKIYIPQLSIDGVGIEEVNEFYYFVSIVTNNEAKSNVCTRRRGNLCTFS